MATMTMKEFDEVLAKGCRYALSKYFTDGITTFVKQADGSMLNASRMLDNEVDNTGKILGSGYKHFKSKQFKKLDAEYGALVNGPCGIMVLYTKEQKLRHKKDLEEMIKVSQR
tara:strand:- start:157 stop:495 length:339 start_codon:yes stop_codon:yes gene_type:complete